jgi:hypothetical protein
MMQNKKKKKKAKKYILTAIELILQINICALRKKMFIFSYLRRRLIVLDHFIWYGANILFKKSYCTLTN